MSATYPAKPVCLLMRSTGCSICEFKRQMSLKIAKSPHNQLSIIIRSIPLFHFLTKLLGDGIGITVTHTVIPQHGLIHGWLWTFFNFKIMVSFELFAGQQSKALKGIIK
jgi:hypothetical protein